MIFYKLPVLLHRIGPIKHKLTARLLLNFLSPEFSQEGSTCYFECSEEIFLINNVSYFEVRFKASFIGMA